MDGDVLFYFTYMPTGDDTALATEKEWTEDPLWKNLNAVQKGHVHKVDDKFGTQQTAFLQPILCLTKLKNFLLNNIEIITTYIYPQSL